MKPGGGPDKGGNFERMTCAKLSRWLTAGKRDDLLCRTVGSGAQFTSAFKKGKRSGLPGDIRAQDPLAFDFCNMFVIECKHWKRLELQKFIMREGELFEAMLKVIEQANAEKKYWLLIAKENNREELIITTPLTLPIPIPQELSIAHLMFDKQTVLLKL